MEIINLKQLDVDLGAEVLLNDVSFSFQDGSRVALVGSNGSGKSTLLKVLAGLKEPTKGKVTYSKGALVEYVPQSVPADIANLTLIECLTQKIENTRPTIEEWKAYDILSRFGLSEALDRKMGELSGGEANRALLARALIVEPNFILLDEPTNHLDSEAIIEFEKLLKEDLRIPFCLVSHDRTLLDTITDSTIFIRDQRLYYFGLPYTKAKAALVQEDEARRQQFAYEAKEIERLRESAERMKGWVRTNSDLATRYQNLIRRVEAMENDRTFVSREKKKRLSFSGAELRVKAAIRADSISVDTPDARHLYDVDNVVISPGDRVAILGRNGAGKTSFLRMIVDSFNNQDGSKIKFNPQVRLGYYDQELGQLNPDASIFDHVQKVTRCNTDVVKKELITAGFPYKRLDDKIGVLSGGEKARLQFVVLKLQNPNVLLLDEPTNHIDVQGIEHLESEINDSEATFIMVSHDRRFIDNVANRYFLIDKGHLKEIPDLARYYEIIADSGTHGSTPKPPRTNNQKESGQSKKEILTESELMARIETVESMIRDREQRGDSGLKHLREELADLYRKWQGLAG